MVDHLRLSHLVDDVLGTVPAMVANVRDVNARARYALWVRHAVKLGQVSSSQAKSGQVRSVRRSVKLVIWLVSQKDSQSVSQPSQSAKPSQLVCQSASLLNQDSQPVSQVSQLVKWIFSPFEGKCVRYT